MDERSKPGQVPVLLVFSGGLYEQTGIGRLTLYFDTDEQATAFAGAAQVARDVASVRIAEQAF